MTPCGDQAECSVPRPLPKPPAHQQAHLCGQVVSSKGSSWEQMPSSCWPGRPMPSGGAAGLRGGASLSRSAWSCTCGRLCGQPACVSVTGHQQTYGPGLSAARASLPTCEHFWTGISCLLKIAHGIAGSPAQRSLRVCPSAATRGEERSTEDPGSPLGKSAELRARRPGPHLHSATTWQWMLGDPRFLSETQLPHLLRGVRMADP